MAALLEKNSVWTDKHLYDDAERIYYENLAKGNITNVAQISLAGEVAKARERIKQSLENVDDIKIAASSNVDVQNKLASVVEKVETLSKDFEELRTAFLSLEKLVRGVSSGQIAAAVSEPNVCKKPEPTNVCKKPVAAAKPPAKKEDDDDVDLFGSESEDEDEEAEKIKAQRVADYAARKSKKPVLIAKSNIILDVKPWDDETDMKELEKEVRNVSMDGLVWGASKLVPLAYGIHKLQISCVVEDDKVSVDELQEKLQEIEDYVQSVDIAAFNKV